MKRIIFIFAMIIFVLSVFMSCKDKYEESTETFASLSQSGCESCHMDRDLLEEVADPIEHGGEEGGEG